MEQFFDVAQINMVSGAIDPEVKLRYLNETVAEVIKKIRARITYIYGTADYQIAIILNPTLKGYVQDCPDTPIVESSAFPTDKVLVLCKSVNGEQIIKPAGDIDWSEYYLKAMAYTKNLSNEMPRLAITKPYLQARIRIKDETAT